MLSTLITIQAHEETFIRQRDKSFTKFVRHLTFKQVDAVIHSGVEHSSHHSTHFLRQNRACLFKFLLEIRKIILHGVHCRLSLGGILGKQILLTTGPNLNVGTIYRGGYNDSNGVILGSVLCNFSIWKHGLHTGFRSGIFLFASVCKQQNGRENSELLVPHHGWHASI
jgi:hypothetical protein